jgi:hypothetical protein
MAPVIAITGMVAARCPKRWADPVGEILKPIAAGPSLVHFPGRRAKMGAGKMNRKQRKELGRRLQSANPGLEVVHPRAAGIDVGNGAHYVAVRPEQDAEPVRRFECSTADGGSFLVAGPGWKGAPPSGIKKVYRSETEFVTAFFRTQLFNPGDLDNVKKVQAGYKVQPLSRFIGKPAPPAAPAIDFIKPLTPGEQRTSPEFFNILNFVLQFCPTVPSEKQLMARFAKLNIGAGQTFDAGKLSPELKKAVDDGTADAWAEYEDFKKKQFDTGNVTSGDVFGTRE